MNLELWFPQPIWFKDYEVDFSESVAYIQELKKTSPGRKFTNIGGWQSEDVDLESIKELAVPFDVVRKGLEYIVQDLQQYGFGKFRLANAWINVNKGANFNKEHVHPGVTFSGCLYLKVSDKSGHISFTRPDNMMLYPGFGSDKKDIFYLSANYKPVIGRLLVFPAWLSHMVLPSEDDEERISISFNFTHEGQ
jgi:uncharacterized protein (TIGR02466 family)